VRYAEHSGNRHELAHAMLVRAALGLSTVDTTAGEGALSTVERDLSDAVEVFRAVGDLRCLTRGYLQLAQARPADRTALLRQALEVARGARDTGRQAAALERLVATHWAAGEPTPAGHALGELITLVGEEVATARCPADMITGLDQLRTAIAEGRARRP
jgi:hypothetical protein